MAEIQSELPGLLHQLVEVTNQQKLVVIQIKNLVGTSGGIDGVVNVTVTNPSPRFSTTTFKAERPALYENYCRLESLGCTFSYSDKPRITSFPALNSSLKEAKKAFIKVEHHAVNTTQILPRTNDLEELHERFLRLEKSKSEVEADLLRFEIQSCGTIVAPTRG